MKAEELVAREEELAGWPVRITSYRLGERYLADVASVDPGARIARGTGQSRQAAEDEAVTRATTRLQRTRRH